MEISVVIPAYNEETHIAGCLESVLRNNCGALLEILVVDNGSTDRTADVVAEFPGVRLITEARKGTGHARQTGAEAAKGDVLAYIDADSQVPPGWLEYVERIFLTNPNVVLLSGPYRYLSRPSDRYPAWLLRAVWWITPPIYAAVGYMCNGGNCAMRADALKSVGGHNRELVFYGDDTDIARRIRNQGRVLWKLNFNSYTSARRWDKEGFVKMCWNYSINYWWPVVFKKPFMPGHHDLT